MDTERARRVFSQDRYAALSGIEIVEAGKGFCKACMNIEDKHLNAAGVVQGGAIFTLADLAFAVAANSHGQLALAINVSISFLKGVSTGTLHATATEVDEPNRLGAYDALIKDDEGQIVATFHGIVYRKRQKLSE